MNDEYLFELIDSKDYGTVQRIAELRKNRGLTQKELAKEIQVSEHTLSAWNRGVKPHTAQLQALADFFGCDLEFLTCEQPYFKKSEHTEKDEPEESSNDFEREITSYIYMRFINIIDFINEDGSSAERIHMEHIFEDNNAEYKTIQLVEGDKINTYRSLIPIYDDMKTTGVILSAGNQSAPFSYRELHALLDDIMEYADFKLHKVITENATEKAHTEHLKRKTLMDEVIEDIAHRSIEANK